MSESRPDRRVGSQEFEKGGFTIGIDLTNHAASMFPVSKSCMHRFTSRTWNGVLT